MREGERHGIEQAISSTAGVNFCSQWQAAAAVEETDRHIHHNHHRVCELRSYYIIFISLSVSDSCAALLLLCVCQQEPTDFEMAIQFTQGCDKGTRLLYKPLQRKRRWHSGERGIHCHCQRSMEFFPSHYYSRRPGHRRSRSSSSRGSICMAQLEFSSYNTSFSGSLYFIG